MANERITEGFFRNHVLGDDFYLKDKVIFEEQSPSNLKIKKLLTNASKSGKGQGFPEFIIQFKENPEVIIVVECKAEPKYHESEKKDNPKTECSSSVLGIGFDFRREIFKEGKSQYCPSTISKTI